MSGMPSRAAWTATTLAGLLLLAGFAAGCGQTGSATGRDSGAPTGDGDAGQAGPVVRTVREDSLAASVAAGSTAIGVGDSIGVILLGEAPSGWTIELPGDSAFEGFAILATSEPQRRIAPAIGSGPGATMLERRVVLTSWEPGESAVPPLEFRFVAPDQSVRTLLVPEIPIAVETLVAEPFDPAQFADLRAIAPLDEPRSFLPWLVGGLVLLVGGAGLTWLLLRSRPPAPQPTPEEWAHAQLALLETEGLADRGLVEPFFVRLVDVARGYLRQRLGAIAAGLTSDEFLRAAAADPRFDAGQRGPLDDLLRFSDLIKFARAGATREECARAMQAVRDLVQSLTPREVARP